MTLLSKLLAWFPTLVLLLSSASLVWTWYTPWSWLCLLFSLYGLPVLVYRLHGWWFPVREGISYLQNQDYSPWWGSHQIQAIYIALPALEAVLRLIPGAFSCWLRVWGARVGRGVYWTPGLEIADRGLLEIGNYVVVGHRVGLYSHAIKPRRQNLMLYVKKIRIGDYVFLGAGSRLGPGVQIAAGSYVPANTDLYPDTQAPSSAN